MEPSNGSAINGNVKRKVRNKLRPLESSLELNLEDSTLDENNDITKRVLRQSTMSQSYAKKSNTKVLPTPEEIASRDSRKRHKRTTPKQSIPTTTKQPFRIKSRSRFDDKPTTTTGQKALVLHQKTKQNLHQEIPNQFLKQINLLGGEENL